MPVEIIFLILLAYFIGAIPFAVVFGKIFYQRDVRKEGSGNAGATNTFRVLGVTAGILVLLLDMVKGVAAILLANLIHREGLSSSQFLYLQIILGLTAALGHIFPVYLAFKGGKGVATFFGVVLYLFPVAALMCVVVFFIIFFLTHYVSLGSLFASVTFTFSLFIWYGGIQKLPLLIFGLSIPVIIMITHKKIFSAFGMELNPNYIFPKNNLCMKDLKPITLLFLFVITACSKVPITNRKQVHLLPSADVNTMALQQYQDVLKTSKVISGTPDAQMVERVGQRISAAAVNVMQQLKQPERVAGFHWEYHLLDSKEVNAWCMPGGKIAVYSGILPVTKDEIGLAVVLAHEVGHAVAQHGDERMSQALVAQMGGAALSVALSSKPQQTQDIFNQAYGIGATYGALLPFSRQQESEADKIGLVLMAAAGYDPHAAVDLWVRMKQQGGGANVPEFLSTHPSDQNRIDAIKAYLPTAMKYYKK